MTTDKGEGDAVAELWCKRLEDLAAEIDRCRSVQGCGYPPCGRHAIGKPTHQVGASSSILVVGEAPASGGWWVTGRAFCQRRTDGGLELSRTGANLNDCLAALMTDVASVNFVEAVRCRPEERNDWRPGNSVRQKCIRFLREHMRALSPKLVLPLGRIATASCLEVAAADRTNRLEDIVGKPLRWIAPWFRFRSS